MNKVFFIIFIVLSTLFIIRYFIVGQAVYGDGLNYWSYTHSMYFDHDLDISNQLTHHFSPESNNISKRPGQAINSNYIEYRYPPLASIFWLPTFVFADIFIFLSHPFFKLVQNGFSDIYQISVGLFNISLTTIGLFILYKTLSQHFNKKISTLCCLLLLFATNLFYYGSLDVINSHPTSFFLSSLFVNKALHYVSKQQDKYLYIIFLLAGLLAATRTQDILFLFVAVILLMHSLKTSKTVGIKSYSKILNAILLFLVGFFPQILLWYMAYGAVIENAYASTPGSFNFLSPKIFEMITFYKTGILYYSPILIISFIGLLLIVKEKIIYFIFLSFVIIAYYIIASWGAWHQGESYGNRMLISSYPFLAFGLAKIIQIVTERYNYRVAIIFGIMLVVVNFCMIFYFQLVVQNPTFIYGEVTKNDDKIYNFIKNVISN